MSERTDETVDEIMREEGPDSPAEAARREAHEACPCCGGVQGRQGGFGAEECGDGHDAIDAAILAATRDVLDWLRSLDADGPIQENADARAALEAMIQQERAEARAEQAEGMHMLHCGCGIIRHDHDKAVGEFRHPLGIDPACAAERDRLRALAGPADTPRAARLRPAGRMTWATIRCWWLTGHKWKVWHEGGYGYESWRCGLCGRTTTVWHD